MNDRRRWNLWLTASLLLCGQPTLHAQTGDGIPVRVTAVFENGVYVDCGRMQGVAEGDELLLDAGDGTTIRGEVRSVSKSGARIVLFESDYAAEVGMLGRVLSAAPISATESELQQAPEVEAEAELVPVGAEADSLREDARESEQIVPASVRLAAIQAAIERVEVRVTASSGGAVYLDQGRAAGIRPGDEVVLYPLGDGIVNATVQSTSRNSSRCQVIAGDPRIDLGTRGEVLVSAGGLSSQEDESPPRGAETPEHPPWESPPEDWDENQPLLAPAYSRRPEERPRQVHGRMFLQYLHTWNHNAAYNQYSLARAGAAMWAENLFGRGDGLQLAGEFTERGIFLDNGVDNVNIPGRIDRFSYFWGGTEERPLRVELGRFISGGMPEFGILDGTEAIYRMAAGHRLGVAVGLLPEPFPNLRIVDDFQTSAFFHWISDETERLSSRFGLQKTWRRGTPDRDLAIWSVGLNPNPHFSLHGTAWGDFYDSRDNLKTASFEISEAMVYPLVRIDPGHGFGATASYVRWPQLLRRDFSPFLQKQMIGDWVLRYGLFTWQELGRHVRIDARIDHWDDQSDRSGTSWETRVAVRNLLISQGEVALAVYGTHGAFSSGPGGRISVSRQFARCFARVEYGLADVTFFNGGGGMTWGGLPTGLVQQSVRIGLDVPILTTQSVSLFADYRFGQRQDALQVGVFYQKRF